METISSITNQTLLVHAHVWLTEAEIARLEAAHAAGPKQYDEATHAIAQQCVGDPRMEIVAAEEV